MTEEELAKLFAICLEEKNSRRQGRKIEVKSHVVLKHFIRDYFNAVILDVIKEPIAFDFKREELGHIQVLQHVSKKGYEWDKQFDSWDWKMIWDHVYPHVEVDFDPSVYSKIIVQAKKRKQYLQSVGSINRNLKKLCQQITV